MNGHWKSHHRNRAIPAHTNAKFRWSQKSAKRFDLSSLVSTIITPFIYRFTNIKRKYSMKNGFKQVSVCLSIVIRAFDHKALYHESHFNMYENDTLCSTKNGFKCFNACITFATTRLRLIWSMLWSQVLFNLFFYGFQWLQRVYSFCTLQTISTQNAFIICVSVNKNIIFC